MGDAVNACGFEPGLGHGLICVKSDGVAHLVASGFHKAGYLPLVLFPDRGR